jgi:hypothetical protein
MWVPRRGRLDCTFRRVESCCDSFSNSTRCRRGRSFSRTMVGRPREF